MNFLRVEDGLAASLVQVPSRSGNTQIPTHPANVFERVVEVLKKRGYTVRLTDLTQKIRVTFMSDL
jgi:hypothetical protein